MLKAEKSHHPDMCSQDAYLMHNSSGLTFTQTVHCSHLTLGYFLSWEQNRVDTRQSHLILWSLKAFPIERENYVMVIFFFKGF